MRKDMVKIMNGVCRILKKNARIVLVVCLLLCFSCLIMTSCAPLIRPLIDSFDYSDLFGNWNSQGDWTYDLVGGYLIVRTNSVTISLGKYENVDLSTYKPAVDSYITCFAYNDNFIVIRKLDVPDEYDQEDILKMDFEQAKYFIVDVNTDDIYGPYDSEEEFQSQCENLNIGDLKDWIATYPAPEGADF